MLGVSFRMASGMVWANYAAKSIGDGCTDCNSRGFGIGYHHFLSKRSELWVATARVSNDANSANSLNGFAPDAPGKSVTGLAAGITLTF
jgi:predicted porin